MAAMARIMSALVPASDRIDVPVSLRKACSSDSVPVCAFNSDAVPVATIFLVDNRDALRDALGFLHVVRRQEHGDAFLFVERLDLRPQLVARLRIETERRLVEEQDLRRVQESARDLQTPLHPAREVLDRVVLPLPEFEDLQELFGPLVPRRARHAVQDAVELHVFVRRQFLVEARILKHDAEAPPHFGRLRDRVQAVDFERSAGRREQRRQHLDRRRLAGAVGAEEREDLALSDVERDVVDGRHLSVLLHQVSYANHKGGEVLHEFSAANTQSARPG
jgi:hypothetical protein